MLRAAWLLAADHRVEVADDASQQVLERLNLDGGRARRRGGDRLPFGPAPWGAPAYGMLTDRFCITWVVGALAA